MPALLGDALSFCGTFSLREGGAGEGALLEGLTSSLAAGVEARPVRLLAPTGFGRLIACAHLGMCRSATDASNLRPQCGHGVRVSSTSGSSGEK